MIKKCDWYSDYIFREISQETADTTTKPLIPLYKCKEDACTAVPHEWYNVKLGYNKIDTNYDIYRQIYLYDGEYCIVQPKGGYSSMIPVASSFVSTRSRIPTLLNGMLKKSFKKTIFESLKNTHNKYMLPEGRILYRRGYFEDETGSWEVLGWTFYLFKTNRYGYKLRSGPEHEDKIIANKSMILLDGLVPFQYCNQAIGGFNTGCWTNRTLGSHDSIEREYEYQSKVSYEKSGGEYCE